MRFKILLISFIFCLSAFGQKEKQSYNWMPLINAIARVESGFNPKIVNKAGTHVGYLQIGAGMVQECNNILKAKGEQKRFTLKDRYDKDKSIEMFILFQEKYNPERNVEKAIRMWNGGPRYRNGSTQGYFNKVHRLYLQNITAEEEIST